MPRIGRREFLAAALGSSVCGLPAAQNRKPNVILIVTDDQGWWDVGVHGNKDIETPVMDRLAAEGVEFTHFYVSPVCSPTRASIMTGRHYLRTGVYNTRFGGDSLHSTERTLPEMLRTAGYRTGICGKWHLGGYRRYQPHNRGFDDALTFAHGHTERYFYPDQLEFNGRKVDARGYITDLLTDAAIGFVKTNRTRPFFLYVTYNVPHEPHIIDDKHLQKYLAKGLNLREARIYGMITQCDTNIGRLLSAVDAEGLREDTIVIFMSDNGGVSKHYTAGLRGSKGSAFEGGVRVPFFARWPGKFPAGAKLDTMAAHIDLMPTLCEIAGASAPANIDGKSILPLLKAGKGESPHDYLFHIWDRLRPSMKSSWSVRGRKYKLAGKELFDLQADPGEKHDISAEHPEIAADLRKRFEQFLADVTRGQKFQPVPIEVGRADENPVEIQASWALIDGTHVTILPTSSSPANNGSKPQPLGSPKPGSEINYTFSAYDWDTIDGWRKPGDIARFRIDVVESGRYEIALNYGCDTQDAGGRVAISCGDAKIECDIKATPARDIFERRVAGVLHLTKGEAMLKLEPVSAPGKELMALNKIVVRRI